MDVASLLNSQLLTLNGGGSTQGQAPLPKHTLARGFFAQSPAELLDSDLRLTCVVQGRCRFNPVRDRPRRSMFRMTARPLPAFLRPKNTPGGYMHLPLIF